jgi:hypothetical protein
MISPRKAGRGKTTMHRVEETNYGYRIVFEGFLAKDDLGGLIDQMKRTIRPRNGSGTFPVLVDMRKSHAFPSEAQEVIKQAILYCKGVGMERNCVILNSAIAAMQAKRLAKETGIDSWIRYIDASSDPEWEKAALDWLIRAVDPEEN